MKGKNFFNWKTNLLSGLLVTVPILISVWIVAWLLGFLTDGTIENLSKMFPLLTESEAISAKILKYCVQILIVFAYLIIVYLIGLFTHNMIGKQLLKSWENFISRIPLISTIYATFHQILSTFFDKEKNDMFSKVVLIEYPKKDMYVIGFLTASAADEIADKTSHEQIKSIFVPTTPNPTSGFLLFVPEKDIFYLEMSVTEGMQLVISGGSVKPEYIKAAQTKKKSSDNELADSEE